MKRVSKAAMAWMLGVSAWSASSANAAPTVYFGEDLAVSSPAQMVNSFAARTDFVRRLSGFGQEGFEGFAAGTATPLSLSFGASGVTATMTSPGSVLAAPTGGRLAVEGSRYFNSFGNGRINFDTPVAAFGLFVTDANEVDNDPAAVTVGGQTLTPAQIDARPFDSVDGILRIVTERSPGVFEVLFDGGVFPADRTGLFVGLIDAERPYTNIVLVNGSSGLDAAFNDGFGYDGLIVSTALQVPVPGTLALSLAGIGMLGWVGRQRVVAMSSRRAQATPTSTIDAAPATRHRKG